MRRIYLDNAATSFPKPPEVSKAVYEYMTEGGSNINRGAYSEAYSAAEAVLECRELLATLFNGGDCKNVIFTKNVTESINVVLNALLKPGDHVLTSSMEHNAVMRPLVAISEKGISFDRIPCRKDGSLMAEETEALIKPETAAIVMTHASNICGTVMPAKQVGEICKRHNLLFILDCAQTAGIIPIDMEEMNISALCFTGHKSLLGPQGTGGFILREELTEMARPFILGGTGSVSHTLVMPEFMPDKFEAGTMNLPGIMGLRAALLWLQSRREGEILEHELMLTEKFLRGIEPLEKAGKVKIFGKMGTEGRVGVVSVQTLEKDPALAAHELHKHYGIATRVGLHCAPDAHRTIGSFPAGTIRFSFGYANSEEEIDIAIEAMEEICYGIQAT